MMMMIGVVVVGEWMVDSRLIQRRVGGGGGGTAVGNERDSVSPFQPHRHFLRFDD
jgi:hypothetical protein